MTIPDQIPRVVSTADGVATEYSYHFYAPDPSHVFVASNGALVTSGWQAVKTSDDDGYIKFNTAPASGVELTIYRSTPMTQETVWSNGEAFYADTLTSAANKLTMIAQELRGGTVNVPGTVTSAQWASSARIASSATSAGSATRAVSATSATSATHAVSATKAGSASYHGPFEARPGNTSAGYNYYNVSGGMVSVNGSSYEVASAQTSGASGAASATVYLVGSSAAGSAPTFSFTTTEPSSASGQFYAPIATFVGAEVTQLQFGNIVDTNWGAGGGGGGDVNFASSAGVASNLTASAAEDITSAAVGSAMGAIVGTLATIPQWENAASVTITSNSATVMAHAAWVYAHATFKAAIVDEQSARADVVVNGTTFNVCSVYSNPQDDTMTGAGGSLIIPVVSGSTVSFNVSAGQNPADFNKDVGCAAFYINED